MQHSPPEREAFIQDRLIFKGGFYTRLLTVVDIILYHVHVVA